MFIDSIYVMLQNPSLNKEKIIQALYKSLIENPSNSFNEALLAKETECIRESQKVDLTKPLTSPIAPKERRNSGVDTLSGFLFHDDLRILPSERKKQYFEVVEKFLDLLPIELMNCEFVPTDSLAILLQQLKDYCLITITSLVLKCLLRVATEKNDIYRKVAPPEPGDFERWLVFANGLFKRGANIELGYIDNEPIFNTFAAHYPDNDNCKSLVKLLIKNLQSPNRTGLSGENALYQAVVSHLPMDYVNILLDNGTKFCKITTHGIHGFAENPRRSVLSAAIQAKNYLALTELLHRGADPNQEIIQDNEQYLQYPNLTPFQIAVLAGDKKAIQIIVEYCEEHNIELLCTHTPAEAKRQTICETHCITDSTGVHGIENKSLAAKQQFETNLLFEIKNKTGLNVYLDQKKYSYACEKLKSAILWLFNEASGTAAAKLWSPVLQCVRQEAQSNPGFKLTVIDNKKFEGCFNNETQSDIYITPKLNLSYDYRALVAHEFGHLYMAKTLSYQQQLLFCNELEKDIPKITALINDVDTKLMGSKTVDQVERLLVNILKPIAAYKQAQSAEYFTRLLVEFPIAFASLPFLTRISEYHQNEFEVYEVMKKFIPNTFNWYCSTVLKQPNLAENKQITCRLM